MPTTSPLSRPLDLVLHIGTGKTGTSSIQQFMSLNRRRLRELGHLYPEAPGRTRHTRFALFITPDDELSRRRPWRQQGSSDPARFRTSFRQRLFQEINESGLSHVIISDEGLYSATDRSLRRLRRFTSLHSESLRVVVYLRRQDDHLISRYQQVVKTGQTKRLAEWVDVDHSRTYDYAGRLSTWADLAEPTALVVRRFERESLVEASLFQDFFDAAGVDARADQLTQQAEARNESLDAEAVEFLRLLNLHKVENEGQRPASIDNRPEVSRLAEAAAGPVLTLPPMVLDAFMTKWEESNRHVALEFLDDPDGRLFRGPRKTTNTTTEQCLDPARLDHFLALAGIPEPAHAALRRLAEREAIGASRCSYG